MKNIKKCGRNLLVALTFLAGVHQAAAQGTTFTYQGSLSADSAPANGFFDFEFTLYTNATGVGTQMGSTLNQTNIGVTNGLFTVALDFGDVFTGNDIWLAMSVRSNGVGSYIALTPLQVLTPTPYAIFANTASNLSGTLQAAQLSGTYSSAVTFDNAGNNFAGNGSGLTSLNASHLTNGTVADALLSSNVALLDASQTFTGVNTFAGANQGLIVNGGPIGTNLFTGLGLQYNAASGEAAIISSLDDNRSFLTFYTKVGPGVPSAQQMKIDRNGVVMIDDQADNNGVINDNTTNGAGLVFGGNSGEGIASQRTTGINKDGLDFYTSATHRMSILHNGNVGIGTTNPSTTLQVNGTATATLFSGDGSGLTNLSASQLGSGIIPLAQLPAAVVTNHDAVNVTLSGTFSGSGAGLTGINAATLGGFGSAAFWNTNGNVGANPTNGAFLGTADNYPLEIHVDGTRGLRIEPDTRGYGIPTLIGGYSGNAVMQPASGGDFIGGGGVYPIPNLIYSNSSGDFIGSGSGNQVGPNVSDAVLGGGNGNIIQSPDAMVGGGANNSVAANAQYSVIGGGQNNTNTAIGGTVGGGSYNYSSGATFGYSTVSGGQNNTSGSYATVAGGSGNIAGGFGSFIGGGGFDGHTFNGNNASGAGAVIGGGYGNIASGALQPTVGGGAINTASGSYATIGGGLDNSNPGKGGTIGGGAYNDATGTDYGFSTIAGGTSNSCGSYATVGGGVGNAASGFGSFIGGGGMATDLGLGGSGAYYIGNTASGQASTVAGGFGNYATGTGSFVGGGGIDGTFADLDVGNYAIDGGDVVGGGVGNLASNLDSMVGGGLANEAIADYSVVPGGYENSALGVCSFAAGNNSTANFPGTFVWSDNTGTATQDDGENQFVARATGGFWFYTTTGNTGAHLATGDTSWTAMSDRNLKKDIEPEDCREVLNKLVQVPISHWRYKWDAETNTPHIGPMAQDFKHTFYPGRNDKGITTLEFDGVELAAIQGLNQKLEAETKEKDAEIEALKEKAAQVDLLQQQNSSLAARLTELEAAVKALAKQR